MKVMSQPTKTLKLLIGLGNPGGDYERTRHNIGFMAIDAIHAAHGFPPWKNKDKAFVSHGKIDGVAAWLFKPQTYMNLSGQAVGPFAHFHQLANSDIYVLHDDIELIPGKVRIKQGGGHAGHNGLKSLDAALGTDYWRVRLGVGRPVVAEDVHSYVLQRFAKTELPWVDALCAEVAKNAGLLLTTQHSTLMNLLAAATRNMANKS